MLLHVRNLETHFYLPEGVLKAVDGISFGLEEKETLALVGESGCGKTIVALSLINLVPHPGKILRGEILLNGSDLRGLAPRELHKVRGKEIGMVFQEPASALNPVYTVGDQIREVLELQLGLTKSESRKKAIQLLGDMGIREPEIRYRSYPFELSGGMNQRVMIALAMAAKPKLLIADEPTTALDLSVQAEILDLLKYQQEQHGISLLLISHDLSVVRELADQVAVMYTGRILEYGPVSTILTEPKHPYTRGLVNSAPVFQNGARSLPRGIPGSVPDLLDLPPGCSFHPRCEMAEAICTQSTPRPFRLGGRHKAACHIIELKSET